MYLRKRKKGCFVFKIELQFFLSLRDICIHGKSMWNICNVFTPFEKLCKRLMWLMIPSLWLEVSDPGNLKYKMLRESVIF